MNRVLVISLLVIFVAQPGSGQQPSANPTNCHNVAPEKHFDRVLIVVLENQSYVAAIKDKYLKQLADESVSL